MMNMKFKISTDFFPTYGRLKKDLDKVFYEIEPKHRKDWLKNQSSLYSSISPLIIFMLSIMTLITINTLPFFDIKAGSGLTFIFSLLFLLILYFYSNMNLRAISLDRYFDEKYKEFKK